MIETVLWFISCTRTHLDHSHDNLDSCKLNDKLNVLEAPSLWSRQVFIQLQFVFEEFKSYE